MSAKNRSQPLVAHRPVNYVGRERSDGGNSGWPPTQKTSVAQ